MKHLSTILLLTMLHLASFSQSYVMPAETEPHEGTWLQWPHQFEYGVVFRNRLDPTWVTMTNALVQSENVHIIAYDAVEQLRITDLLTAAGVPMTRVDFRLFPTNDVWVRDNGPIYVRDAAGNLHIEDWGFNGWGTKFNSNHCNPIPTSIATATATPVINLNATMTIEGGAYELDGNGVLLACKSSTLSQSPTNAIRNPGMTQAQAEGILTQYLGATKFIWLDGYTGTDDITDAHIDGFAKFANETTLVTMSDTDLAYWGVTANDIATLNAASDVNNAAYNKVYVPLTQNDVVTTFGTNLGYKGSYCNYYIGNVVVLVPNYNDPNDVVANNIIQALHPTKAVFGIDCRNLYQNGGMVHCVTQQQPVASAPNGILAPLQKGIQLGQNFPNPCNAATTIGLYLDKQADVQLHLYNAMGTIVAHQAHPHLAAGDHALKLDTDKLPSGIYDYIVTIGRNSSFSGKMVVER